MLFIDLGGLSRSMEGRVEEGHRIDWFRLAKHLAGTRRLTGAVIFDRAPGGEPGNPKRRFHDHLRYSGFRVVVRPDRIEDRLHPGELNVAFASELIAAAYQDRFDVAVLVTLDRALMPAIERISQTGKVVEVAGLAGELNPGLRRVADRVHHIDDLPVLEILPSHNTNGDTHHDADDRVEDDDIEDPLAQEVDA
jgi:uncharacterized LabA/DUF88 family protein